MSNFTIEGRMKSMPDVQRTWMWNLKIPKITTFAPETATNIEDLIIRCRSISIPSRTNTAIVSDWMGTKQWFPGRPEFPGTLAVTFEETEDMKIAQTLYEWQERIFSIDPTADTGGKSLGVNGSASKRSLSTNMTLSMYNYKGDNLPKNIVFYNSWVQNVADVSLDYTTSDSVKYNVTFQYDFWKLQ